MGIENYGMTPKGVLPSLRYKNMGQRGAVVWFTGLSGSGKSTLAISVEKKLISLGYKTAFLDGDIVRCGLCVNLGFSEEDRNENIRRIAEAAKLIAESGQIVLVSAISPLISQRQNAREIILSEYVSFTEVYMDISVDECIKRDPKGLYARALRGEIPNFTGISAPYEPPIYPDIRVKHGESIEKATEKIAEYCGFLQKIEKTIESLCKIAVFAGGLINEIYKKDFDVEYKDDESPLTDADTVSDRYINGALSLLYPDFARLSEETADNPQRMENDYCFIIDPLDGTKEFVKKNGEFTVNIGLSHCGNTILGVIFAPVSETLYYGGIGLGSYKSDDCDDLFSENKRISVSQNSDALTLLRSRSHPDERTLQLFEKNAEKIKEIVISGSSIKGCLIAEGKADAYYRFGKTSEWDTCAMQAIVENAGGEFFVPNGEKMTYNRKNTINEEGFIILNKKENLWNI